MTKCLLLFVENDTVLCMVLKGIKELQLLCPGFEGLGPEALLA